MLGNSHSIRGIGRKLRPRALWNALREEIGIVNTLGLAGLVTVSVAIIQGARHRFDIISMGNIFIISTLLLIIGGSLAAKSSSTDIEQLEFYLTRDKFEAVYKFDELMNGLTRGSTARFIGMTLFHLMNKLPYLKRAIAAGATIQLCLVDPRISRDVTRVKTDFNPNDVYAALSEFRKLIPWLNEERPQGSIELRFHRGTLFDSFVFLRSPGQPELACWDLSFGRDTKDKRIAWVDATRGIGQDLCARYLNVWKNASSSVLFLYHDRKTLVDREELFPVMNEGEES